jgi:beta-galactosidase
MKNSLLLVIVLMMFGIVGCSSNDAGTKIREQLFNDNWQFMKVADSLAVDEMPGASDVAWEAVSLPHTASVEPLVIKGDQWQGTAWYRKSFFVAKNWRDRHLALRFEGAMQVAEVYINGRLVMRHYGGYLPFYVELNDWVNYGAGNTVMVRLNNEDNPQVPPGKSLKHLDFNIYSGIYRNVWFINKDKLHVSDAVGANRVAGGGIMVSYQNVSSQSATVQVRVEVENQYADARPARVLLDLISPDGITVVSRESDDVVIQPNSFYAFSFDVNVDQPALWSPDSPSLYRLAVHVVNDDRPVDFVEERIGIRTFRFTTSGFELNGKPLWLRGTNRHQEYPYVGYALSDNANYRDAWKIKEAGFNFVRLSHYPQSQSFMDACDELGLFTMDAIPGWQFFGDSLFQERAISDVRNMVRRDRNRPSVILWEASLNESRMSHDFMRRAHDAVHEELPVPDVYTCGWIDDVYDVYIPARQHGKVPYYWNHYNRKPIFIAEYGDWEYYAQNAGFNQTAFNDLTSDERNSRQLRGFGQKRLVQQALNYQEAHNSNLKGQAAGDANWLMFDYNRGYAPDLEASGIMDIFRLPKFAFWFYKSQAGVDDNDPFRQPFVEIANYYNDPSFMEVKVFSNCEEVELFRNGTSLGRQRPDNDNVSDAIEQPPFTFRLKTFVPGQLEAKGYINGEPVANHIIKTPGQAARIHLTADESGRPLQGDVNDLVFIYARVTDDDGIEVPDYSSEITFNLSGDGELIGYNPITAEAGIATIILKAGKPGDITVTAEGSGLVSATMKLQVK